MPHILRYDQFKTGYTSLLSIRPDINENLLYLDNRYNDVNEGFFSELPGNIWKGAKLFWDGMTKDDEGDWSFRNIAHTVADIGGIVGDYIYPGAGVAIDIVHGISYFIEAGFEEDESKRNECMLFGTLTLLFAHPALNPLQGIFKLISKSFKGQYKLLGKLGKGADEPVIQQIERTLKNNKPLDEFMETVSKNLTDIETFFAKELDQPQKKGWWTKLVDWLKRSPLGEKAVDFASFISTKLKNLVDRMLQPFRNWKARGRVGIDNLKSSQKWYSRMTGKTIDLFTPSSLGNLFRSVSGAVSNFSKGRKVKIFDTMMENISKAQKDRGLLFSKTTKAGKLTKENLETVVLVEGRSVRIMNPGTGGDKAYAILKGKTTNPAELAELQTYWSKQWDDLIETRKGEFTRGSINPKNKQKWIDLQVSNSRIREVSKSDFVQKWYKEYEAPFKSNAKYKILPAIVKFYCNVFGHNPDQPQGGDPTTNTDIDVQGGDVRIVDDETTLAKAQGEVTLSEAEATEVRDEWSANAEAWENFTPSYEQLSSEEKEYIARSASETSIDIDLVPPIIDINYVVWKILSEKYGLEMPQNPINQPFAKELERYQEDENLSDISGELDEETLEALYNDTDEPAFRTFLEAFMDVYLEVDEQDEEDEEYKEIPEEDSEADKEKKPKRGEKIKKFGKWLAGTLEEE
jgi:hypothetical protein